MESNEERLAQLKKEVSFRSTDYWFGGFGNRIAKNELIRSLVSDFMPLGPMSSSEIHDTLGVDDEVLKDTLFGIPRRFTYPCDNSKSSWAMTFMATSPEKTVLLSSISDYFNCSDYIAQFDEPEASLNCIVVQTACQTQYSPKQVVGIEWLSYLKPYAYYAHSPNTRIYRAMRGEIVPDDSAMVFMAQSGWFKTPEDVKHLYQEFNSFYNDHEVGNLTKEELTTSLFDTIKNIYKARENEPK